MKLLCIIGCTIGLALATRTSPSTSVVSRHGDKSGGATCRRPNPTHDFHVDDALFIDVVLRADRTTQCRNATNNAPQIRCVKKGRAVTTDCPDLVVCTRYRKPDVAWDCVWSANWMATMLRTTGASSRLQYEISHEQRAVNAKSFRIEIAMDATVNEQLFAALKRTLSTSELFVDESILSSKAQDIALVLLIAMMWMSLAVSLYASALSDFIRKRRPVFELALVGMLCTLHTNVCAVVLNSPQHLA